MANNKTTSSSVRVSTREFERAHGRRPRGDGAWAFFGSLANVGEPVFFQGPYASCKARARQHFAALGVVDISVGS